jgi:ribokinase
LSAPGGVELTVVGSINLDFTVRLERLPRPGETLTAHQFIRTPGGKGANQAVAAARLGAKVTMVGAVGEDELADEALAVLVDEEITLEVERRGQTGVALIYVDAEGENEIAVFPGANAEITPRAVAGAVLSQLEVPDEVVYAAAAGADFFALNAANTRPSRAASSSPSPTGRTAPPSSRTVAKWLGRPLRRSSPRMPPPPAMRSPPRSS